SRLVGTAVPVEDLLFVLDPGDPELRDLALADLPLGVVGMLGEDQGFEPVFAVDRFRDPIPPPEYRRLVRVISRSKSSSLSSSSSGVAFIVSSPGWVVIRFRQTP
ncbi:MAG: hypothetical protein MUF06_22640, partial [Pirellulaceae bacterium]|nr:hypothetical protein [Pirellulaceae bacterium]